MREYEFSVEVNKANQKEGNRLCFEYLSKQGLQVEDVSENPNYFKEGIDLIIIEPDRQITIDVKTDEVMASSKNIAIELVEIAPKSSIPNFKAGWLYKTSLDYIMYLDWQNKEVYRLPRPHLMGITFNKPRKGFATFHPKQEYFTLGVLIPIEELQKFKKPLWN